jgi:biotin carboxyl carrier protein
MKMEHTVQSSAEGVVVQLGPANGALIKQGEVLVSIQPLPEV